MRKLLSMMVIAACGGGTPPAQNTTTSATPSASASTSATATTAKAPANPFEGAHLYVDPAWTRNVEGVATADPAHAALVRKVAQVPTAVWIDSIARTGLVAKTLDAVAATHDPAMVPVFVLYDLPNRDCAAKSSAGELAVEKDGEKRYAAEVVDPIAAAFRAHASQRAIIVVEPDSLPNIATNLNNPKCAASDHAYRASIAYAVKSFAMPNVSVYLDAAHSGWLGWDGNRDKIAKVFSEVLTAAGGADKIRGFAINVSGYGAIDGDASKKLEKSNPCDNETVYADKLAESLAKVGVTDKGFIIDTSRDGVPYARTKGGNWCNVKNAGFGPRPRVQPSPRVDAYVWIKPPGESDGTSDPKSARYDTNCSSEDAMPNAPEAGTFFTAYFTSLAQKANPPL
jgi:cellulose 1,4-beta-cellobiosidase